VFARATLPDAQAEVGTLDQLPELVARIGRGPAILVIGDVVTHAAPWSRQNLNQLLSNLLEAAE
jgi:uroporphyrin-III C-methyltransferase/precorrin-2 dehydrogenase/sirohydrochlorin ferrochelatase